MKKYDIIVLGTGVGLGFVETAIQMNLKCAVIEPSKFGGTCLTRGCIPSKVLTTAADYIRLSQDAAKTGVKLEIKEIDLDTIFKRMQSKIDNSIEIENSLLNAPGLDVYKGYGEFVDDKTLKIRYKDGTYSKEIKGDTIVVAVGARTYIPDIEGLEESGYYTSERFFNDHKIAKKMKDTKSIVILGAGAIGLEFAHFFTAIGIDVTLISRRKTILPKEEPEISDFVMKNMIEIGVKIHTFSQMTDCMIKGDKKLVKILNQATNEGIEVLCDEIFISPGIISNSDLVKIENTNIKTDSKGYIVTDEHLRTNVKGVWALGDINGKFQLRHKANYETEICAYNIFNEKGDLKSADYTQVPWAVFTYPEVAHLGMTLKQALEGRDGVFVGVKYYSTIAKGFALGIEQGYTNDGFVKLILDRNMQILGAHIVGYQASVLIHSYIYLMGAKTILPLSESMTIHPALSELTSWVVSELEWVAS